MFPNFQNERDLSEKNSRTKFTTWISIFYARVDLWTEYAAEIVTKTNKHNEY
jgi:hypothetical protein